MTDQHASNNFDILRLFAAIFVVFCHSFGFYGEYDPFYKLTAGYIPGGQLAVYIFFIISGYLITKSWLAKPELLPFLKKRFNRIVPAYLIVIFFTLLIIGPAFTTLPIGDYFKNPKTWSYLVNLSFWKLQFELPGVFETTNPHHTVNAPIWTLFFEILMYGFVVLFGLLSLLKKNNYLFITLYLLLFALLFFPIPKDLFILKISARNFVIFFTFFFSGSLCFIYNIRSHKYTLINTILLIASILLCKTPFILPLSVFTLTAIILGISFLPVKIGHFITKHSDLSYEIYLYGYLVQNIVKQLFGEHLNLYGHFIISIVITIAIAIPMRLAQRKLLLK